MKAFLALLQNSLYQLILIGALLAALGILAVTGHVDGGTAWTVTMVVTGGGALLAGIVLGNPAQSNSNLFPHFVLSLMLIGMILAMALQDIFTATMIKGFFATVVGSGGAGVGVGAGVAGFNTAVTAPAALTDATIPADFAQPARPIAPGIPADQAQAQ